MMMGFYTCTWMHIIVHTCCLFVCVYTYVHIDIDILAQENSLLAKLIFPNWFSLNRCETLKTVWMSRKRQESRWSFRVVVWVLECWTSALSYAWCVQFNAFYVLLNLMRLNAAAGLMKETCKTLKHTKTSNLAARFE